MNTAKFVANELRIMGLTVYEGIGKTGIVAELKAGEGKTVIGLRADMDAIQLEEPGKGSKAMIDDGLFEKYSIDEIYYIIFRLYRQARYCFPRKRALGRTPPLPLFHLPLSPAAFT